MEAVNKVFLAVIVTKLAQPAKCKIEIFQVLLQMYVEKILALLMHKYSFYKIKINEKKMNLKIANVLNYEKFDHTLEKYRNIKELANHYFTRLQAMDKDCITYEDTTDLFCEPYIYTGYRPTNKSYGYYIKSLFKKHNETINALSHYIGAIYCLTYFFRYDISDKYTWPLLAGTFTSVFMLVSSATAHLLHQKSHDCHMTCFQCDFTGISLYSFGSSFMQMFYCSPIWYYQLNADSMIPLISLLSMSACLLNCFAQTNFKRPYPPIKRFLQFFCLGLLWIYAVAPLFLFLISSNENELKINIKPHLYHIFALLVGAAIFALEVPQRYYPGRLDFIGQGHHIFHLCMFLKTATQINACFNDYLRNKDFIQRTRIEPTFNTCFITMLLLLVYDLTLVVLFRKMIAHNFDKNGNFIKKSN